MALNICEDLHKQVLPGIVYLPERLPTGTLICGRFDLCLPKCEGG